MRERSILKNRRYDIDNENFDNYFLRHISKITPEQKSRLPQELAFKVFRGGSFSINSLTFMQKMYVLYCAFGKRVSILVEDDNEGLSYNEFAKLERGYRGSQKRGDIVDDFNIKGTFVLGMHDLVARLEYANHLCSSNLWKLAKDYQKYQLNNIRLHDKQRQTKDAVRLLRKLLVYYEGNKKRMAIDYGIDPAEWLALLHFYDNETKAVPFVDETFKYSYNSNKQTLRGALVSLQHKGILDIRGSRPRNVFYYLTPKGVEILGKIIARYILNY